MSERYHDELARWQRYVDTVKEYFPEQQLTVTSIRWGAGAVKITALSTSTRFTSANNSKNFVQEYQSQD